MNYQKILRFFNVASTSGNTARCYCPAHDDANPSLTVTEGDDGRILLHCHAGCTTEQILKAVGLTEKDLFNDDSSSEDKEPWVMYIENTTRKKVVDSYDYYSPSGKYRYTKVRLVDKNGEKSFIIGRMEDGKFHSGLNGASAKGAVYGDLKALTKAISDGRMVYIVEGEKDVNTMHLKGLAAVTYGAAGNWDSELASLFQNADVCIIADNDDEGKQVALNIKNDLNGAAKSVKIILPAPDTVHGDVSDFFAAGHTVEELEKMVVEQAEPVMETALVKQVPPATEAPRRNENGSVPPKAETKKIEIITANELDRTDLPTVIMIVDGLIPVGLSVLAAPPKYGKSWMVQQLCLSVAEGTDFLGRKTHHCGVLYLALEDGYPRLKERQRKILNGYEAPRNFFMANEAADMGNGFFEQLEDILKEHLEIKMIVIDTLQKIRTGTGRGENVYASDYKELGELKHFADKHEIAIVVVHHTRKMQDLTDPFANICGSNGVTGATDTMIVLSRESRDDDVTRMSITGRDVESADLRIRFNKNICRWELIGTAEEYNAQLEKDSYDKSPIVKAIKLLLEKQKDWKGSATDLIEDGRKLGIIISDSSTKVGKKITDIGEQLYRYDHIISAPIQNGSGGKKYRFYYEGSNKVPQTFEDTGLYYQEELADYMVQGDDIAAEEDIGFTQPDEEGFMPLSDDEIIPF